MKADVETRLEAALARHSDLPHDVRAILIEAKTRLLGRREAIEEARGAAGHGSGVDVEVAKLRITVRDLIKYLRWFRERADFDHPTVESAIADARAKAGDDVIGDALTVVASGGPSKSAPSGPEADERRDVELDAIRERQARPDLHPLTCGNDGGHAILEPHRAPNGKAILYCPDCDYVQTDFPGGH